MSENNKIYVTASSQTISANVKVDNSGYFTEKAQQYAEQSEASAQKSQANVDRLLANEDFINVSQNLDLIVEAGQKIEGIDLEAILNAEASAKASSESALASANLSEENAQTTTTNAQLSKTYRGESEEFSETSKNYMNNALRYKQEASTFRDLCYDFSTEAREQALDSQVYSNNSLTYSNNAKTSETNALTYSNNAKTSEANALKYSNNAKGYLDEVKAIVPTNFTTLPIGSVISINASANYTPSGFLPCDGAEYSKADFEQLWDNYLTGTSINLYAFYLDLDNALCLYTTSPTPVSGDEVYELVNGQMVITSHIIAMITDESIVFESSTDGELYTTHRDITKDTSVIISNPLLNTCTYAKYEQDLATYGQCGKFAVKPLEYDGSKLTIVGSPAITEDGIASGFVQGSSYITASLNINASKMVVRNKFNYKVNTTSNSMLYWFNGIALRQFIVNNGDLRIDGTASPSNLYINVPASNFKENDVIETELIIDTSVILNIKVNGVSINQYTSDRIPALSNITLVGIGSSYYQGNNPYQGSIDLKGFSIDADNNTILQCGVGETFKVPTIEDTELGLKNFVVVSNGTVDDCLATWNTLVELENYLKEV